jgi:hypothetical protein
MKEIIQYGSTSVRQRIVLTTASTGAAITAQTFTGMTISFFRDGDTTVTHASAVTAAVGTWTSLGFIVVDATNAPGVYEIGIPNAAFANNVRDVIVYVTGASGQNLCVLEFQLVPWNPQDTVRLGLTALPNVAQGTTGQVALGDASGRVTVITNSDKTGYSLATAPPTAAAIAALILATPTNLLTTDTSGRVTLIPADVPPTAAAIATATAAAILVTPTHLLAVDASGYVTYNNSSGTAPTVAQIAAGILKTPANLLATDANNNVISSAVLGAVGSVAGNVGGSVAGSIGGNLNGNLMGYVLNPVELDMTQVVPRGSAAETVGDALMAARVQGGGTWEISTDGLTLTQFFSDGVTPAWSYTLNSALAPTSRIRH